MIGIPDQATLNAIRDQGYSGSIFSKQVGKYKLSCIYRPSSAEGMSSLWYAESAISTGNWCKSEDRRIIKWPKLLWQGEGWSSYLWIANELETEELVTKFLKDHTRSHL